MELREWLIILGLALVTLIVIDGVRRLRRQRLVPRLDQVDSSESGRDAGNVDPEAQAREEELNWELPNGGARVVRPAEYDDVQPKPNLQRQDHPGPSRVLSEFRRQGSDSADADASAPSAARTSHAPSAQGEERTDVTSRTQTRQDGDDPVSPRDDDRTSEARREPALAARPAADEDGKAEADTSSEPLKADPEDHEGYDEEHYRLVDLEGMSDSLKNSSKRVGSSMQRFGASLQKSLADRREHRRQERLRREQEKAEKTARDEAQRDEAAAAAADRKAVSEPSQNEPGLAAASEGAAAPMAAYGEQVVRPHPVLEKALRHDVAADHAREALSQADEIIVISVMSRDDSGFSGTALLELMLACGLRYSRDMGIFHRFETEDSESALQFSMVNVVKPGTFPIEAMDDFHTPGVTLLMPLPGATDASAAFEAMVETAMVVVRHLGGELKDEHLSVMTAQTVEFARQRVQEFVRRNRLNRYQVN